VRGTVAGAPVKTAVVRDGPRRVISTDRTAILDFACALAGARRGEATPER